MTQAQPARRSRWRRVGLGLLVGLPAVALVGLAGGWVFLRSDAGNRVIRTAIEVRVDAALAEGDLELGALHTNAWNHVVIERTSLRDDASVELLGFDQAELELRPLSLLGQHLSVPTLHVDGLRLILEVGDDQRLGLARLFGPASTEPGAPWDGLPVNVIARDIAVTNGMIRYAAGDKAWELRDVNAAAAVRTDDALVNVKALTASGTLVEPTETSVHLDGHATWDGDRLTLDGVTLDTDASHLALSGELNQLSSALDAQLNLVASPLDLLEVNALIGEVGLRGGLEGSLSAVGPLSALHLQGDLSSTALAGGTARLDLVADVAAPRVAWTGSANLDRLDVEALYPGVGGPLTLDGDFSGGGDGLAYPNDLDIEGALLLRRALVRDYVIGQANLPFQLHGGVVHLEAAQLATGYATAAITGDVNAVSGELDLSLVGKVDAAKLRELNVEDLGGRGAFQARVRGNTREEGAPLQITGAVHLAPFRYTSDVRFDSADIRYDVHTRAGRTDVSADVQTTAGVTYGVDMASLAVPAVAVTMLPDGTMSASGTATPVAVHQADTWTLDGATGTWRFDRDLRGATNIDADLALTGFTTLGQRTDTGRAVVHMRDADVGFGVLLNAKDRRWLETDGRYELDTARLVLSRMRWSPLPDATWETEDPLRLTLTAGGVADAHVALRSRRGAVRLDGTLGTSGPLDARLRLEHLDLAAIQAIASLDPGLAGTLDLDLTASGTGAEPVLDATVDARGVGYSSLPVPLDVVGKVRAADGLVYPTLRVATTDGPLASVRGELPAKLDLSAPGLDARGRIALDVLLEPGRIERLAPFTEAALPTGVASAELKLTGLLYDPGLRLRAVIEADVPGWQDRGRTELDVRRLGGFTLARAELYQGFTHRGSVAMTSGNRLYELFDWLIGDGPEPPLDDYELFANNLFAQAELDRVPAAALGNLAGSDIAVDGVLTGTATITGSPNLPDIAVNGTWTGAKAAGVALGATTLEAKSLGDGYSVRLDVHFPAAARPAGAPEPMLAVRGRVPVRVDPHLDVAEWGSGVWDLSVSGVDVPLQLLSVVDPGITRTMGELQLDGTVHGELYTPAPNVALRVHGGALDYTPLGLRVSKIELDMEATDERLRLKQLSATTSARPRSLVDGAAQAVWATAEGLDEQIFEPGSNAPSVVIAGSATLKDWGLERVSGQVLLHNALLSSTNELSLVVTGTQDARTHQALTIGGEWPALSVSGAVEVTRAEVLRDVVSFQQTAPLELDPSMRIHREGTLTDVAEAPSAPPLYESFNVAVDVDLGRNIEATVLMPFVDNYGELLAQAFRTDLRTRVGGHVAVSVERGELALRGKVEVLDGSVRMLHRSMTLKEGTLLFSGNDYLEPRLDLHAWTAISGADVTVDIGGTPSAPTFHPSSPGYADESQVLTMLLTGQRPEDLSAKSGEALNTLMTTGLGLLLGNTSGSLANIKGSFEPDGTVRIGVPASRYLFLEYTQRLQYSSELNNQETHGELTLPGMPGFTLEATAGDHKSSGNVVYEFRF